MAAPAGASTPEAWTNTNTIVCRNATGPGAGPVVLSVSQFRRLPIPPAQIRVQPDPRTRPALVNIDTNLYTTPQRPVMTTTVLGTPIQVRATPARYRWTYGDGTTLTTTDPGGPYPHMPTAHIYTTPGKYQAALRTTFTGEYSVRGGPWQPVTGTASVTTDPVTITVLEARTELVP